MLMLKTCGFILLEHVRERARDKDLWLGAHCIQRLERQAVNEGHPLQPINVARTFRRVYLIDMQDQQDNVYRFILHAT